MTRRILAAAPVALALAFSALALEAAADAERPADRPADADKPAAPEDPAKLLGEMEVLRRKALAEEEAEYFDEAVELREKLAELVDPNYEWLVGLARGGDALTRDQAYKLVGYASKHNEEAIAFLVDRFRNGPGADRDKAAAALAATRDPKAAEALLAILAETKGQGERIRAIRTLGDMGAHEAADPLTKLIEDPSKLVRLNVYVALGKIGRPAAAAMPLLEARLGETKSALEKVALLDAMNRIDRFQLMRMADQMSQVRMRLAALDPGEETQESQELIVKTLDDLIDAIEEQMSRSQQSRSQSRQQRGSGQGRRQGQQQGQSQGRGQRQMKPGRRPGEYYGLMNAQGTAGRVESQTRRWPAQLPGVEYEKVLRALSDETLPSKYRKMLEAYYENLAKDAVR
jgi:hypothetical protein